jgi:nucleoid-associated protein YgaU
MMRTVRFLTGLVMVVTGVSLAAPMATRLVEARLSAANGVEAVPASASTSPPVAEPAGPAAWAGAGPVSAPAAGAGGYCIPDPRTAVAVAPDVAGPEEAVPPPLPADELQAPSAGYQPPPPPDLLPAAPADLSLAPPAFNSTYRSTLDVPPPPLLDVAAPAPLAVSTPARDGGAMLAAGQMSGGGVIRTVSAELAPVPFGVAPGGGNIPAAMAPPAVAPSSYTIRDGDDLTSIATRLYGHPGAAEAIWSANRDRLTDPAVLPIGLSLRIPPTWVPPAARQRGLAGTGAPIEPARRPARVRVAPGESLESLAERFYGDRAMAARLWEANRDQLRSPALLVAGMDLRLP